MAEQAAENIEKTLVETTKIKGRVKTPEQIKLGEAFFELDTWEDFERNIDIFHGNDCGLEFSCVFLWQDNPNKRVDLDYAISQASIKGQSLSAYCRSGCAAAGIHSVNLLVNGSYTKKAKFRLHVAEHEAARIPTAVADPKQATAPAASPFTLSDMAALVSALKPDPPLPPPDNSALWLEMIRSQREDTKEMLLAFKEEIKELKDSSASTNDIIDNMRELKELQKEFTPASTSVTNAFQKIDKKEEVTDMISLAKYAFDKIAPALPIDPAPAAVPAAAPAEPLTPAELVEFGRENIVKGLASASFSAQDLINKVITLVTVASEHKNMHLVPELFNNQFQLEPAIDDLLAHCQSDQYRQEISEAIKKHPQYGLVKLINLSSDNDGHRETNNFNGSAPSQKIEFS